MWDIFGIKFIAFFLPSRIRRDAKHHFIVKQLKDTLYNILLHTNISQCLFNITQATPLLVNTTVIYYVPSVLQCCTTFQVTKTLMDVI